VKVAIIGGGIAGLSAAVSLLRGGAEPVVFEAAARAGGKVGSVRDGPWLSENGPHFIARPMDALVDAAGLRGEVLEPAPPKTRWVNLRDGVFRAPSFGLLARIGAPRAVFGMLFSKAGGDSLQDLLVARFGPRAGSVFAQLFASGVYAGDPAKLSGQDAFPSLFKKRQRTPLWSLRSGLGQLPLALAAQLGDRVRLSSPVKRLAPGFEVDGEKFDKVVLALPAPLAAPLVEGFAPDLAGKLAALRNAPVAIVHLGLPQREVPRGFGSLDATGAMPSLGALLPSSMLPGRAPEGSALVTVICGGARHRAIASLPDADLLAIAREGAAKLLGAKSSPTYSRIVRWLDGISQYEIGHASLVAAARKLLPPGLMLTGASYDGVSVPESAASGALAAAEVLRYKEAS
jgi:oxygen-dependent protoporphyrinogen oxidase